MAVPPPRAGKSLKVKSRPLKFSYWPMRRSNRRYGLNTFVFADEPWPIIRGAVETQCPKSARPEALGFLDQASDFYRAASTGSLVAAKPVLLYYSFLNLVK